MSEPILLNKEFTFVIDTNQSSFLFSRQLCAYCTGYEHENVINTEMSDKFYEDLKIDDEFGRGILCEEKNPFHGYVVDRIDENGSHSPCSVYLNKNYGCNEAGEYALLDENNYEIYGYPAPLSVGIFFDQEPTQEQIELLKSRSKKFFAEVWTGDYPTIVEGFRLIIQTKYAEEKNV